MLICAFAILFASCASLQGFEKRKYLPGFYADLNYNKTVEQNFAGGITMPEKEKKKIVLQEKPPPQPGILKPESRKISEVKKVKPNGSIVRETHPEHKKPQVNVLPNDTSDEEVKKAKAAKGWAIAALICLWLIPYASIIFAIIAYSKGKRILENHKYEPEFKGRKDAMFAFKTGRIIIIVSVLLAAILTIAFTIGFCQFLYYILGVPVC